MPGLKPSVNKTAPEPTDPFHPIIYVRGYAMTENAMEATVHTPYMGFNLGSTRARQQYDRSFRHYIFESPLIRLMKEYGYQDSYADGINLAEPGGPVDFPDADKRLPRRSIIIHRYYEEEHEQGNGSTDSDAMGRSQRPSIEAAAVRLSKLIARVRDFTCGDDTQARAEFKVYLVAHSMGGLICRCLLQNEEADPEQSRRLVDKVFTYGTPHNGIEVMGLNVPRFFSLWDAHNFNRAEMAGYLKLKPRNGRVNSLNGAFPNERFFCLVGTNPHDYNLTRLVIDKASDGLVTMDNAYIEDAPRVHTYTSHSGPYGMVNSKIGYDNLVRFLFGDYRLRITMQPAVLPLSPPLQRAYDDGATIRGSYLFECTLTPRGDDPVPLSSRRIDHHSAVFRSFDELLNPHKAGLKRPRYPVLASVFLDSKRIEVGTTMVMNLELNVEGTDFRLNGGSVLSRRAPAEHLFRQTITLKITLQPGGWRMRYIFADQQWSDKRGSELKEDEQGHFIELKNSKGFAAKLYLQMADWR
ncbi:hypothetical protein CWE12_12050 [Aliidiomarina sedimenti]|uniref:GPI inositol-deacylase PGAP1-like alpha/beta domain-containing protein n=1 Tax=Aliidiomarina sedimenti TaxID=1933879 RepID=A0ABY0BX83_9GAMM|nr:hypothetical protein [Aliidiomarina sedimenti]RUO29010.1 hypothetical protein CWE12_12050 [Aliidiomarina sedimenti]